MGNELNVPGITGDNVKHVFEFMDEVVEQYPDRVTGGGTIAGASQRIKAEFEKCCDKGSVKNEEFEVHPKSFLKHMPFQVLLYFASAVLLYFNLPWAALAGFAVIWLVSYSQNYRYWHILDPLFPRKTGYNVSGCIEPQGEVKQQIIVSGHHDAAYVFQLLTRIPKQYFPLAIFVNRLSVVCILLSLVAAILAIFGILLPQWIALIVIALGIFYIPYLFFTTNQVAPGAGDNMVAVALANEIGAVFAGAKKSGNGLLKHTRLMLVSLDAEEAGLRGASAYVKKHKEELLKTRTYVFNMDSLYYVDSISFLETDLNSLVKLSSEMAQECVDVAKSLGYNATIQRMVPGVGSTDAAIFGRAGIKATSLAAMSWNIDDKSKKFVYHTPDDVSKYIEPAVVEAALHIACHYIVKKDKEVARGGLME